MNAEGLKEYLDGYLSNCRKSGFTHNSGIKELLEDSLTYQTNPSEFKLNGNKVGSRNNRINDDHLVAIMQPMLEISFLKIIDLSYNEFGDHGAKILAQFLQGDKLIQKLVLTSNSIGALGASALAKSLQLNQSVTDFDISYNDIGDEGGMEFARMLQVNTTITNLNISSCHLKSNCLIAIWTVMRNNETLSKLNISNNMSHTNSLTQSLSNDVMIHLSRAITGNIVLKELNLCKSGITDWSICDIFSGALSQCTGLETLDLSSNRISRDGGVALCKALKHSYLASLKLSCCSIQDEGAIAVADLIKNTNFMKRVYLDFNKISGIGIIEIAKAIELNVSLEFIALWGNKWSTAACDKFAPLVGGPMYSVAFNDSEIEQRERVKSGKSRLFSKGSDVVFYKSDGVLNVAHQNNY